MLRKISIALVLIALVLVPLIAYAQSEKSEPARLVRVDFNSRPEFAEIRVDGVFIGTAPLQYRLAPGLHKVEFARRGFETWTRQLFVSADNSTNVTGLLDNVEKTPGVSK